MHVFKKELSKFVRPEPQLIYNVHDNKGLKLLRRLGLCLCYLGDHKFVHNFQESVCSKCTYLQSGY